VEARICLPEGVPLFFGLGGFEIAIIAIFGFLIFGPDKLPQIARTIGRGIRQFRSAQEQMNKVIKSEVYDPIKDLEPLVNPFAGFSLDPTKDEKTTTSGDKDAAGQKKVSGDAMKAAISAEAVKAKEKAASGKTGADKTAEKAATKKTASDTEKKTATPSVPAESFAQRRARLEQEHAKAKAAKASGAEQTAQNTSAVPDKGVAAAGDVAPATSAAASAATATATSAAAAAASSAAKPAKTESSDERKEDKKSN
jgi:colicin import membrane protein